MNEVTMSGERAIIHRPTSLVERNALQALPEGAVVIVTLAGDSQTLARAYRDARANHKQRFDAGASLSILSVGPLMDSPDDVQIRRLTRAGAHLELEIVHTSARSVGTPLLRNAVWRPLVQVPIELTAGRYDLRVSWRALVSLPDGEPLKLPAIVQLAAFRVHPRS